MLVISRHRDERTIITHPDGTQVTVIICDIRVDKVRMGFDAPDSVTIHREEVQRQVDAEKGGRQ